MATGTVTWVDAQEGHGFITTAEGADVFANRPTRSGDERLVVGATVEFEQEIRRGHVVATNVDVTARPTRGAATRGQTTRRQTTEVPA